MRKGLAHGIWVAVCDGKKALLLRNLGELEFPNLETVEAYSQPDPKTSEQGTDRPGRVSVSVGSRIGAMEPADWHGPAEARFVQTPMR